MSAVIALPRNIGQQVIVLPDQQIVRLVLSIKTINVSTVQPTHTNPGVDLKDVHPVLETRIHQHAALPWNNVFVMLDGEERLGVHVLSPSQRVP